MCGRFDLHELALLEERYGITLPKHAQGHYNTAPTQKSPVILGDHAEMMAFGLLPNWGEKPKPIINARAETVAEKRTFKKAFETQRCLVPANGYFEWKRENGKQPYYFHVKGEDIFSFAGIWTVWERDGKKIPGFAILTTEAGKVMAPIHNREPVILDREEEKQWLNPDLEPEQALKLLDPFEGKLELWPVSKLVNSPKNNTAAVIEPV